MSGSDHEMTLNVCPGCAGRGWVRDKPWKGPSRWWSVCPTCENRAGLDMPDREPGPEDEEWGASS